LKCFTTLLDELCLETWWNIQSIEDDWQTLFPRKHGWWSKL